MALRAVPVGRIPSEKHRRCPACRRAWRVAARPESGRALDRAAVLSPGTCRAHNARCRYSAETRTLFAPGITATGTVVGRNPRRTGCPRPLAPRPGGFASRQRPARLFLEHTPGTHASPLAARSVPLFLEYQLTP